MHVSLKIYDEQIHEISVKVYKSAVITITSISKIQENNIFDIIKIKCLDVYI